MHGEDGNNSLLALNLQETPPYARGRHAKYLKGDLDEGNTPVCTGKTQVIEVDTLPDKKHPRMHGEDDIEGLEPSLIRETPPYARGRLGHIHDEVICLRNTPVCTGKTNWLRSNRARSEKHPRMHGEDPFSTAVLTRT